MTFNNSQKALAITILIVGTFILSILNVTVFKMDIATAEIIYDVEQVEVIEEFKQKQNSKTTNKAYNTSEKYTHYAQAYKPIAPPEDYNNPRLKTYKNRSNSKESLKKSKGNSVVTEETLTSFNNVNEILLKQSNSKPSNVANTNTSIYYSLKGRFDEYLPIPIYLCNSQGKIVINILVDANGNVTSAYINNASTTNNACLQEYALIYAKKAKFSTSSKKEQLGSITYEFKGK